MTSTDNINLLQDGQYRKSLIYDFVNTDEIYIECLTLAPFLIVLLRDILIEGCRVRILTNDYNKKMLHGHDFLENRKQLRELGAEVFSYNAPHLNHQKIVLIRPDIIYLGSHNMTGQSNFRNRESSVRLIHPEIFNKLLSEFKSKSGLK